MKRLVEYINEALSNDEQRRLSLIIKAANADVNKTIYMLTRIVKKKEFTIHEIHSKEELEKLFQKTIDEPLTFGRFQALSNDKEEVIKITKLSTFRKDGYRIVESCGGSEHKIVKDSAGNWRIKGTPGKGTNTDKEGLWAAKYDTEEDAKKALAAYHMHKNESFLEFYTNEIFEGVKADNGEPWEVYVDGHLDSHFTKGAEKWKKMPKIGNGCYAGGTVFKVTKIDGNKVYMEEDK